MEVKDEVLEIYELFLKIQFEVSEQNFSYEKIEETKNIINEFRDVLSIYKNEIDDNLYIYHKILNKSKKTQDLYDRCQSNLILKHLADIIDVEEATEDYLFVSSEIELCNQNMELITKSLAKSDKILKILNNELIREYTQKTPIFPI